MNQAKKTFNSTFNFANLQASNDNFIVSNKFSSMQELKKHRQEIDAIDYQIAELLGKRFRIAEQVAEIKRQNNIPVRIEKRINEVLDNATKHENLFKMPEKLGYYLWREIIEATCYHEEEILGIQHDDEE